MCKECRNKGYLIKDGDVKYCECEKGRKLKEIEDKRNQKGYNDNY